jgi:glycopeptide antibiotics resistance protein
VILLITILRREPGSRSGKVVTKFYWGAVGRTRYELKAAAYSVLNIALFVPFGLLIALRRGKQSHLIKAFIMTGLLSFLLSFSIECTQVVTQTGLFEVTDMFNNTLGGVIGAFLGVVIVFSYRRIKWNVIQKK